MNNELMRLKFASSAIVSLLGVSLMLLLPFDEAAYAIGPVCMMGIIMILIMPIKRGE